MEVRTHALSGRIMAAALAIAFAAAPISLSPAQGQVVPAPPPLNIEGERAEPLPEDLKHAGIDEKLQAQVPLDLTFKDEAGRTVKLADYLDGEKPVVLNFGYFSCPMLCGLVWKGMVESLNDLSWTPGDEFTLLTVSFDPTEGPALAAQKKQTMLEALGKPEAAAGWHVLTGDEAQIRALTQAVGFGYRWDDEQKQFAHQAALVLLTPEGKVSRYLYGVKFDSSRLRLSLVEASEGRAGSTIDRIVLYCFHYDSKTGQYTAQAMNIMRLGGALTLGVLVVAIGGMLTREALKRRAAAEAAAG